MVNVIMIHHEQVYSYYLGSRSLLCLMSINAKFLLQAFIANLTFIYISRKENFSSWKTQNSHLLFSSFSPLGLNILFWKFLIVSVEWHVLNPGSITVTAVFWQAFDYEH